MYNYVGEKIQTLAKIVGWTLLVIGVIAWLSMIADDYESNDITGWVCLISGGLSLVSSWFLYGFGQLVDDVQAIRYNMTIPTSVTTPAANGNTTPVFKDTAASGWTCACGKVNPINTSTCSCGINKRDLK